MPKKDEVAVMLIKKSKTKGDTRNAIRLDVEKIRHLDKHFNEIEMGLIF